MNEIYRRYPWKPSIGKTAKVCQTVKDPLILNGEGVLPNKPTYKQASNKCIALLNLGIKRGELKSRLANINNTVLVIDTIVLIHGKLQVKMMLKAKANLHALPDGKMLGIILGKGKEKTISLRKGKLGNIIDIHRVSHRNTSNLRITIIYVDKPLIMGKPYFKGSLKLGELGDKRGALLVSKLGGWGFRLPAKLEEIRTHLKKAVGILGDVIHGKNRKKLPILGTDDLHIDTADVTRNGSDSGKRLKHAINLHGNTSMLKLPHITNTLAGNEIHLGKLLRPIFLIDRMTKSLRDTDGDNANGLKENVHVGANKTIGENADGALCFLINGYNLKNDISVGINNGKRRTRDLVDIPLCLDIGIILKRSSVGAAIQSGG